MLLLTGKKQQDTDSRGVLFLPFPFSPPELLEQRSLRSSFPLRAPGSQAQLLKYLRLCRCVGARGAFSQLLLLRAPGSVQIPSWLQSAKGPDREVRALSIWADATGLDPNLLGWESSPGLRG